LIEYLKKKGFHFEKYIATEYQYSDYWREINKKDSMFSNFSEGNCDTWMGFDSMDHSQENLKAITEWSKKTYDGAIQYKLPFFVDANGRKHSLEEFKKRGDEGKFKHIAEMCGIRPGMTILEIGFGEGDFMSYIRKQYGISVVGVSISDEQVKLIRSRGFQAYTMNSWDMTPEVLGTYDLILHCGSFEYILCTGESPERYTAYSSIIYSLLNPDGQFFITCIHLNEKFGKRSFYDQIRCYFLWSGNDGQYPTGKDGFTRYAKKAGLEVTHQEERTNDYFITSVLFMSSMRCFRNNKCVHMFNFRDFCLALFKTIAAPYYVHTYICYSPTDDFTWLPWLWQFIPQFKRNPSHPMPQYVSPTTLEYILLHKK
jgi:cyclopropane fatty-acyl-phospholipid synthase-like methyltransferase